MMTDHNRAGRRASRTVAPPKVPMSVYLPQDIAQWVTDEAGRRGVDRSRLIAAMILAHQCIITPTYDAPERNAIANRLDMALRLLGKGAA